jgi:hypothetical protein
MWPYWFLFLTAALPAVLSKAVVINKSRSTNPMIWVLMFLVFSLMIGLRYQVGGDWLNYLDHYDIVKARSLNPFLQEGEQLYWLVMWLAVYFESGVYLANLIFSCIFCAGLFVFCRYQPRPWLGLVVAIPYMVIVIAMGYTRQSVALGFLMLGLISLQRQQTIRFIVLILFASLFHRTAALVLPLAVFVPTKSRLFNGFLMIFSAFYAYQATLASQIDTFVLNYITARYQSDGAFVRITLNLIPALGLIKWRNSIMWSNVEKNLWMTIALTSIGAFVWLLLSPSSTAVDRMSLYLMPIQIYFYTRLPDLVGKTSALRGWVFSVVLFYALIQFVWLFFSNYSFSNWVPYQFYPIEWLFD